MRIKSALSNLIEISKNISKGCISIIDAISNQRLKVALVSYYYQKPTISGVGVHVQNLAKYLVKHNCEVHIFCHGDADNYYKENGAYVHVMGRVLTPAGDGFSKKRLEYDIFESDVIKDVVRENMKRKFDVIHTHGALTKAAFILRKVYNIKWVHTFHAIEKLRVKELSKEEKQFEDLISWIEHTTNYCDGAIFVSKDLSDNGKRQYTLKSTRIIPNGVDLELFKYSPITKKNVLFIGRFSKDKGIDLLPELIEHVMEIKDATFTAICPFTSTGGELKEIRSLISRLEKCYKERLRIITASQHQEKLIKLYQESQVYIQPSKYESFGLCILEAMAIGRPVVAFNVGGIPEVIGDSGFVTNNKKEFIYKVKQLLDNKKDCVDIGKKANQRAKKFDWDIIAKKTIQYYNEVKI
ncbi:MAG TPA: glycosyltransferase family 4 protein [Candidatus Nanoarchaeia archaeon]|nr:glycosyltransferase family 4 protein [Candidatus Nanoarchaeia archaeon]